MRKKLALDQREAEEIFGGGVDAVSRYENGKTKPPLALVKLLKMLDRHPDLPSEVKAVKKSAAASKKHLLHRRSPFKKFQYLAIQIFYAPRLYFTNRRVIV